MRCCGVDGNLGSKEKRLGLTGELTAGLLVGDGSLGNEARRFCNGEGFLGAMEPGGLSGGVCFRDESPGNEARID